MCGVEKGQNVLKMSLESNNQAWADIENETKGKQEAPGNSISQGVHFKWTIVKNMLQFINTMIRSQQYSTKIVALKLI